MEQNTDNDKNTLENSTTHKSEKPSETKIPIVESESIPTHAHQLHKLSRKNIRHYVFEFLMLFLAVFCGFLADNWREKLQEHKREKVFMHSIVEDLKSDTLQSGNILAQLKKTSAGIDSVLNELSSPEVFEKSNKAYSLWTKNLDIRTFVSNDRTMQQLKNSGGLRIIRNKAVSDEIMRYDQAVKNYYQQSNFMYSALSDQHVYSQLFDFISLNKNNSIPVPLTAKGKESLNEAYAHLQLWNSGLMGLISWLENVNNESKNLIVFIQKEYHIN